MRPVALLLARVCCLVILVALGIGCSKGEKREQATGPEAAHPGKAKPAVRHDPVVHPLSPEGYRSEFRYLRRVFRSIDLTGPPVRTDGRSYNIPEAEWPFMGLCYFAYACAELAKHDPALREEALEEMRFAIRALQTPRLSGFIAEHFGPPFGSDAICPSAFVHGLFLQALLRYREVSGDPQFDPLAHRTAAALSRAYEGAEQGILPSYPGMWWLADNFGALGALARYDRLFERTASKVKHGLLEAVRAHYVDRGTGLFCTYIDPPNQRVLQGPRGISVLYGLHFLKDFAPEFAAEQYQLARRAFVRTGLGLAAARESPEGTEARADVDSGPVLFGLGLSASGFAIAAAANQGDRETAQKLVVASAFAGMPDLTNGELRYAAMPAVGQAVVLFGKALLAGLPPDDRAPPSRQDPR